LYRPPALAPCPSLSADSTDTDDGYNTSNAPMTPREDDGDTSSRPMTPAYIDFDQAPKAPTNNADVECQPVPIPDFDDLLLVHQHAMLQYADEYTPELADSLGDHCHETEDALRYKHHEMVQLVNDLSKHHSEHTLDEQRFEVIRQSWIQERLKLKAKIDQLEASARNEADTAKQAIQEKNEAVAAQQQAVEASDKEIRTCNWEKDNAVRDKVGLQKQVERLVAKKQQLSAEKKFAVAERDSAVQEKDKAMDQYDKVMKKQDDLVKENEGLKKRLRPLEARSVEIKRFAAELGSTKKRKLVIV
jgi:hypothetical protein